MAEIPKSHHWTNAPIDLEVALQVDSVCDAFELSWKDGNRPDLKDYLHTTSAPAKTLFVELVLIDINYRRKAGELPVLDEYVSRFPELGPALENVTVPVAQSQEASQDVMLSFSLFPRIGNFELRERIGEGAFGVVWKAWDIRLRRWVALKRFRDPESAMSRKLLLREARAVALIDHPNVVDVYEINSLEDEDYVVFEYLSGGTLAEWMKQRRTPEGGSLVTPQRAAELALQLADGLSAVHSHGVVHRDFKPGNVLLDEKEQPKIVDFGLARHSELLSTISGDGVLMGTIPYMSPEQCLGSKDVTTCSDIYSLGAVLYEILTGQRPLRGSRFELLDKIQTERPTPPSQLATVPRSLENICLRALEKNPQDRYASAAEMMADLRTFLDGKTVPRKGPSFLGRLLRGLRANWLTFLSVGILMTGLGSLWASRSTTSDDDRKIILLDSTPPGANVALIPLDSITGAPQPERIVHARGRTPLRERLVPPGDYLVEVYLDDGNFHEVYRRVPEDRETLSGQTAYYGWRRDNQNPDTIRLASVKIPMEPVTGRMALVPGSSNFRVGKPKDVLAPEHQRVVPPFYMDVTEVPLIVNRELFQRDGQPDLRWKRPPGMQHAFTVTWLMAVWMAEIQGKRLPDEFEYELAATNLGRQEFPWGNDAVPEQQEFLPVGEPAFDCVTFDRPVYGLCSNVAEWTMSWSNASYPPFEARDRGKLHSLASLELRVVRGGNYGVIDGQPTIASRERDPRDRMVCNVHRISEGLGFRCARSPQPRLTPEDFSRPMGSLLANANSN